VSGMIGLGVASMVVGSESADKAGRAEKRRLAFDEKQYADWKAIYGPIEENLSEYYTNLTPERLTAQGLQGQQAEFQRARTHIQENLTQRGLADSGVAIAADTNLELQNALARAKIRSDAPERVREQQQSFLQGGEARRAGAVQNISSGLARTAESHGQQAASQFAAAGSLLSMGISNIPTASDPTLLRD